MVQAQQSERVLMLMFEKATRHCKAAMDALGDLIDAAEDAGVDDKMHVEISDAYRVIEEYKAATYACGQCGSIQENHECQADLPKPKTPIRFKVGRWRFSLWRHGGFRWGYRFDNRTAGSVSFGLGCLTFMRVAGWHVFKGTPTAPYIYCIHGYDPPRNPGCGRLRDAPVHKKGD